MYAPPGGCREMRVCTIVATNYLAHARVLARSLASHNPGVRLAVLVVDADRDIDASQEPFDLVSIDDLELDRTEFHQMAAIYDVMEFSTAVKPWLLRTLLRWGAEVACYLDPDIQ